MKIFKILGSEISYKDIIQLDGAFSIAHINYGKSSKFNNFDGKDIAKKSRKNSYSNEEKIQNVYANIYSFNGTEKNCKNEDRIILWENYWLEYINAFNELTNLIPNSIVTIYVGRQSIEIGLKYLLLKKTGQVKKEHDLGNLCDLLYAKYNIKDEYMNYVDLYCKMFCKYIEGENSEYFRYPEYKQNLYFAGNRLDIKWLTYNLALVILKLLHFADLESKFKDG